MAFRKIIFDNSTPLARDHAAVFAGALSDGRLSGAAVTYSGGAVNLAVGYFIVHGREIYNDTAVSYPVSGNSGVAQLVLTVDVSGSGSVTAALRYATEESALSALVQEDINDGSSTTYEVELALVNLASGQMVRSFPLASMPVYIVDAAPTTSSKNGLYFVRRAAE